MANNREASQFNSVVHVNDTTAQVGIANSVGINTTTPQGSYSLYVQGTTNVTGAINSQTDVQVAVFHSLHQHQLMQPHLQ